MWEVSLPALDCGDLTGGGVCLFEEANDKYPDADRAINELGWRPQYDLQSTILETLEYIRAGRVN